MENCSNQYFSFSLTFWEFWIQCISAFLLVGRSLTSLGFALFSHIVLELGFGAHLLCLLVGESLISLGFCSFLIFWSLNFVANVLVQAA
jgi:hypothetical protein